MPQREYDITIAPDGTVEVHVQGFKGKRCLEMAKVFQQIIGEMQDQRLTSAYYEPDEEVRHSIEARR